MNLIRLRMSCNSFVIRLLFFVCCIVIANISFALEDEKQLSDSVRDIFLTTSKLTAKVKNIDEELEFVVIKLSYADSEHVLQILQESKEFKHKIMQDKRTNSIIVKTSKKEVQKISEVIKKLDSPVRQLLIEARIVIMNSDSSSKLGALLSTKINMPGFSFDVNMQNKLESQANAMGLNFSFANDTLLDLELTALEAEGKLKVISNPRLMTADRQTAYIESGEELPYEEHVGNGNTSIRFKKAVMSLKVTPYITPDKHVLLDLNVSQDGRGKLVLNAGHAISTQEISTTILAKDGETVMVGGILQEENSKALSKVPLLGDMPLIGNIFSKSESHFSKRELVVFISTKIL